MWRKIIFLSVSIFVWVCSWSYYPTPKVLPCIFTALDVGQGDAILIQTSDRQDILIDGGPDNSVVEKLGKFLPPGDRDIELLVLTHPHADHVNGLVAVVENFTVRSVLLTNVIYHQIAYEAMLDNIRQKNIHEYSAVAGQRYNIGRAQLDILWPVLDLANKKIINDNAANGGGVNDSSIVIRLNCNGSTAMLMGDASSEIEERIVESGALVQSPLLKVGHHGSRFSSSPDFLAAVKPRWAVISVGAGNGYKHPHPTAMLHLKNTGATILRTDERGDIKLETDGRGGWRIESRNKFSP